MASFGVSMPVSPYQPLKRNDYALLSDEAAENKTILNGSVPDDSAKSRSAPAPHPDAREPEHPTHALEGTTQLSQTAQILSAVTQFSEADWLGVSELQQRLKKDPDQSLDFAQIAPSRRSVSALQRLAEVANLNEASVSSLLRQTSSLSESGNSGARHEFAERALMASGQANTAWLRADAQHSSASLPRRSQAASEYTANSFLLFEGA